MVTVGDLTQYYYCPRKIYFLRTLEVPHQSRRKMDVGKEEHDREMKRMLERKDLFGIPRDEVAETYRKLFIEAPELGICGLIDVIFRLKTGEYVPVDLKYTDRPYIQRHWRKQLTAYAILIDFRFGTEVRRGILYFPKQNDQESVDISPEDKKFVLRDFDSIRELIISERVPRKVDEEKCRYCEVAKYCV